MPAAPKAEPVRRNARVGPLVLPAEGRSGPTPKWPLDVLPDRTEAAAERRVWADLWGTPQAAQWEKLGWVRVVARYVRVLRAAERLDKDCMSEARQLEDRLGLTPKSMRLLLWTVAVDEVAERRDEQQTTSARGRIKAVG